MKTKRNNPATELSDSEKLLVRKAIRRKGWTVAKFATRSDLALSTIQQYFSGSRSPSQDARESMAVALGLDVAAPKIRSARIVKRKERKQ